MRAVIQRVHSAEVRVKGEDPRRIGPGLLLFLGVERDDQSSDGHWLAEKVSRLRCFELKEGRMDASLLDIGGEAMVISQFTLFGTLRKGTRPSFNRSAEPAHARSLYEEFVDYLSSLLQKPVPTGSFGKMMAIDAANHGPVTLILDTRRKDL